MFKSKFKVFSIALMAGAVLLSSCKEKMIFQLADDPGYVTDPVVAVRALDGDKWLQGQLDNESKTVTFEFHTAANLDKIVLEVER